MIASVLRLSRSDCKVLKITMHAYSIHRVVYELFPGESPETFFLPTRVAISMRGKS